MTIDWAVEFNMRVPFVVFLLTVLFTTGCGGSTESYAEVEGCVYYQGAPLAGGTIVFVPDSTRGGSGPLAQAEIRSDGHFQLHTGDRTGAVVGWHRITVASAGSAKDRLPRHYCDPEQSGLCREVKTGPNAMELRLE